jgi:ferredoxin--NADP+ reductase
VAVVGGGPAGFYAAAALLRAGAEVDLFERLPAPSGLVRYGVAPDHQKIKGAARAFDKTARSAGFRYFGNVEVGRDVSLAELAERYDQVLVSVGAAADRRLGIPGEDLEGSVPAVAVVGWYNGHPDFSAAPPLDADRAVIVGVGNVALDVARVLVRHPVELEPTDIDEDALEALRDSRIQEVVLLARRGPAEAAFDLAELNDLVDLVGVDVGVSDPEDRLPAELAAATRLPTAARAKLEAIARLPRAESLTARRRVVFRFFAAPRELRGDGNGRVRAVQLEATEPTGDPGHVRSTGRFEELPTSLVIRSIGYRALPLQGLPFLEAQSIVPNEQGRVVGADGRIMSGLYVAGWIKRGPTGLIGTNRSCAQETVRAMLEDALQPPVLRPPVLQRSPDGHVGPTPSVEALLRERHVRVVSYPEWLRLDAAELERGQLAGRVRVKTRSPAEMVAWLDRKPLKAAAF